MRRAAVVLLVLVGCAEGSTADGSLVLSGGQEAAADEAEESDSEESESGESSSEDSDTSSSTGTTSTTTSTTDTDESSDSSTDETTEGELPELPCDPGFDIINPNPALAGQAFTARFTHATPHVHIGMSATQTQGFGSPMTGNEVISGNGPFHWTYTITGHGVGVVTLTFTADMGQTVLGTCQVHVI